MKSVTNSLARTNAIVKVAAPECGTTSKVFIADVSGSMQGRKFVRLRESLRRTLGDAQARILAFSYSVWWCDSVDELPHPEGGTDLGLALREAAKIWPAEVLVISDGSPNDEDDAIEAARLIPGVISTLFVGDDETGQAMAFMRRLARLGGGEAAFRDLAKVECIESDIRRMLALEPPIAL